MIFNGTICKQVREWNMQIVDFINKLWDSIDPGLFIYRKFGISRYLLYYVYFNVSYLAMYVPFYIVYNYTDLIMGVSFLINFP